MLRTRWDWLYVVALACAGFGGCRCGSDVPAKNADSAEVTPAAPEVGGEPVAVIESRTPVVYPQPVALRGDAPPIRPAVAVALPPDKPADPPGRVAVSGWRAGTTEPLLQMINIDQATVVWSTTGACRGAVRSATKKHLVCSAPNGGAGIDVVDAGSGARIWRSSLQHVTSGDGVVVAADARGMTLLDGASGEPITRLRAPAELASELRRVCRDRGSGEVTLVGWNQSGSVVVYDVDDNGAVERRWDMQLPGDVLRDQVCQGGVMLFSFRRDGQRLWARYSASDGRFIGETPTGVDRVGAETSDFRAINRAPDGTLELADIYRGRVILGAPVRARQLFVGANNLLAAGRSGEPSAADRLALYRLSAVEPGSVVPALAPPAEVAPEAVPAEQSFSAKAALPDSADVAPVAVSLAGDVLWVVAERGGDRGDSGDDVQTEIVSFDLGSGAYGVRDGDLCTERGRGIAVAAAGTAYACATREPGAGRGYVRGRAKPGASPWTLGFSTLDDVRVAGGHYVAVAGSNAVVVRPATGETVYRIAADNGFSPRFAGIGNLIVHVEPGRLVARDPARGGAAVWHVAFDGYPVAIAEVGDRVAVAFRDGSAATIAADGSVRRLEESGVFRGAAGALWFDGPAAVDSTGQPVLPVRARRPDGTIGFDGHLAVRPESASFGRRTAGTAAPVVVEDRHEDRLVVVAPATGRVLGAVRLPAEAIGTSFATAQFVGALTSRPLTVHTWPVPEAQPDTGTVAPAPL